MLTFREAPPTRNPSISGLVASSPQFAADTEPKRRKKIKILYNLIVDTNLEKKVYIYFPKCP
jgi:hypothetical protein